MVAFILAWTAWLLTDVQYAVSSSTWQFWATLFCTIIAILFDLPALYSFYRVKTSINPLRPENAKHLVTSGVFRLSRNPMYVGLVFWLLAFGCFISSFWILPGAVIFIIYITLFQILPEEKALKVNFGDEFEQYKKHVRMWL